MLFVNCITQKSGPLAGALTAILLLSSAGTAHAYQCKVAHKYAEAIAPTKAQSIASVKAIWHNKVNDIYGLQWSAWDIAKSKRITCSATGNNQWCRASAKPCLYVIN
jgi:hypothetical protein